MLYIVSLFVVKVPVLSVHRIYVEPKLSTATRVLDIKETFANFLVAKYKMHVSYKFKTPGQLAHITPIVISPAMGAGNPISQPPKNVYNPTQTEKIDIILTNLAIYFVK